MKPQRWRLRSGRDKTQKMTWTALVARSARPAPMVTGSAKLSVVYKTCTRARARAPFAQVFSRLHKFASVCFRLHPFAPVCTSLHSFASVCNRLRPSASVCVRSRPFASVCARLHYIT